MPLENPPPSPSLRPRAIRIWGAFSWETGFNMCQADNQMDVKVETTR